MSTHYIAILFLILGNLAASLSDVAVKILDGDVPTFQYLFFRQLFSVVLIWPLWRLQNKQSRQLRAAKLNILRAHLLLVGSGCMVVAITHLTLATANAVFYAAPLLMLPLSMLLLKETPSLNKVLASFVGFAGVLVVLRPSEFHWAAFFALGTAMSLALFNITARQLPREQSVITTLFWTSLLSLPASTLLMLIYWQPMDITSTMLILASASLILAYNGFAVAAYKRAPAGNVAVAENSGLVFVTLFGVIWFNEVPDWLTAIGIVMIVVPLIPWRSLKKKPMAQEGR